MTSCFTLDCLFREVLACQKYFSMLKLTIHYVREACHRVLSFYNISVQGESTNRTSSKNSGDATLVLVVSRFLHLIFFKSIVLCRRLCKRSPTSIHNQSRSDEINTIIELKLQVAQQKETIDRLSSDLEHAISEKETLLSKIKPPPKPILKVAFLVEEKAHSDNTKALHQQYNELQDRMIKLQKTMDLQKEQMIALEEDNEHLTNERNSFQAQLERMSYTSLSIIYHRSFA